jgi:hypothetical protein
MNTKEIVIPDPFPTTETYANAQLRLLLELAKTGLVTKPTLKIPQVKLSSGESIYFHKQAVYLESHSLFIDIRGMNLETFLGHILQAKQNRAALSAT